MGRERAHSTGVESTSHTSSAQASVLAAQDPNQFRGASCGAAFRSRLLYPD